MALNPKSLAVVALATAMMLLFVVVCPATPTPVTVVSAKGKLPAPIVVIAVGAAFLLAGSATRITAETVPALGTTPILSHASLLDLTCARLC